MALLAGNILQSRYRVIRPLGQGGMGAVYLAEDLRLTGRLCAIKENIPDPNANASALKQIREQFQAEARILANLDHPNLPKVSDYFSDGGNEYIVMEFVEGKDLACHLADQNGKPLPEKPVLLWADQVLDALEYLHSRVPQAIIHRDIKPANIILMGNRIKLVDFGLVKLLDPTQPATRTVMKGLGTPEYAPLEQYAGSMHTDARSDIYSLGATLYHLLTNTVPPNVSLRQLDATALTPPRQIVPALSAGTQAAVLKAMEVLPKDRFQAAHDFRTTLSYARAALQTASTPVQTPQSSAATAWAAPVVPPAAVRVTCPKCGQSNAADELYCQKCTALLAARQKCPHCGNTAISADTTYCPGCGRAVKTDSNACLRCGHVNAPGEIYCQHCANPIAGGKSCHHCGKSIPLNTRYCPSCGNRA